MSSADLALALRPDDGLVIIDGAAWLKQLMERPGAPVLLPHDEAVALARDLAIAQARAPALREQRMVGAIAGLAAAA